LPIADCRLEKQELDSCWNLPLIYSGGRNDKLKQCCKQEMSFPRKRESINLKERETTTRLYVGADICVRPNTENQEDINN